MTEILWPAIRIIAGAYLGLCVLLFLMQKSQIYVPDRHIDYTPADGGMNFEGLLLKTSNDSTISAWYIPASEDTKLTVLFCHGNGGDNGDRIGSIRTFHDMGFNTLIFDYQGYGESTGSTTEQGTYDDAMAAWKYLTEEKGLAPGDIIIFGRSLGGAVAVQLAEQVNPRCLVVESTFSSAPDMAAQMFPFLPSRLLCRYKYNSLERIRNIHCPVMVAHGPDDDTVPFELGKKVFETANEPKHFFALEGAHNAGGIDISPGFQALFKKIATAD